MASDGNYVTLAQIRSEGVADDVPDVLISRRITKWEKIVEKFTRNVFRELAPGKLTFDGNNSRILHFSLPIISLSELIINDETVALGTDEYLVHNQDNEVIDDRLNPRIELTGARTSSIFRRARGVFVKGMNQYVTATWGFMDRTGTTYSVPTLITDALIQLVCLDLDGYFQKRAEGVGHPTTAIQSEKTDEHEITYMQAQQVITSPNFPQDLLEVIMMY